MKPKSAMRFCCFQIAIVFALSFNLHAQCTSGKAVDRGVVLYQKPEGIRATPSFWQEFKGMFNYLNPPATLPFQRSVAFLVGVSSYAGPSLNSLPGVENDLNNMCRYLLSQGGFDVVYIARGSAASVQTVDYYMMDFFHDPKNMTQNDRLLFYYSGHGSDDGGGDAYLQFSGAIPGEFGDGHVLAVDTWRQWSNRIPAKHALFIFDACVAGETLMQKGGKDNDKEQGEGLLATLSGGGSRTVVTAGSSNQASWYAAEKSRGYSVFTSSLLDVLQDPHGEALISIDEAVERAAKLTAAYTDDKKVSPAIPDVRRFPTPERTGRFAFLNPVASNRTLPESVRSILAGKGSDAASPAFETERVHDLVANSRLGQSSDPEISVLGAAEAVSIAWQGSDLVKPEAEDQLHRAILASQVRLTLNDQSGPVNSVAWSPDGTRLATGSGDNTVEIRDAATGTKIRTLNAHPGLTDLAWRPDSKRLATVSSDNTATLWDTATGKELLTLRGQSEGDHKIGCCVAWSPDGKRLVTGSGGYPAIVWDAQTGSESLILQGGRGFSHHVAWSPDGKRIATGGFLGGVGTWDSVTGKPLPLGSSLGVGDVTSLSWSPDGMRLAAGNSDGMASTGAVWDVTTGKLLLTLRSRDNGFSSLAWSPDSKRFATGSWRNTATIWDADTGEELLTLRGHTGAVLSISWRADGKELATGSADATTKVWNTAITGTELMTLGGRSGVAAYDLAWSPDGSRLAIARSDNAIVVRDIATGKELVTIHSEVNVRRLAWTSDGKRLVSRTDLAKMWDAKTGQELRTLGSHDRPLGVFAWSPGGERVAVAGVGGIDILDATTAQTLLNLDRLMCQTTSLAWSPDGTRLADACNQLWAIWDSSTGRKISSVSTGTNFVTSVVWSPDGKWLALGTSDQRQEIWNAQTGEKLLTLPGYGLSNVVWNSDSTRFATSNGNVAEVWDRATGQKLLSLEGQDGILSMAWSPDGKRLATGSTDSSVQVYAMDIGDLMALARDRVTAHPSDAACLKYLHVDKCPTVPALP